MGFMEFLLAWCLWSFIVVVLLSVCLIGLSNRSREKQNKLLYYPNMPADSTILCESPADKGYTNFENVHIRTSDGVTLRGYIMWPSSDQQQQAQQGNGRNVASSTSCSTAFNTGCTANTAASASTCSGSCTVQPQYVILYFHGNAGNVGHRIPIAAMLTSKLPCAILMVDYRGFGLSDSVPPTEEGLKLDAQACLEYLWGNPRVPRDRVFVMGTSLGGAVAIHLGSQVLNAKRIAGLIIENSFASISDMASALGRRVIENNVSHFPTLLFYLFHFYLKPLCLRIGWNSIDLVQEVKVPMLFISGLRDELVPPSQMRQLFVKASGATAIRKFVEFPEGMHNTIPLLAGYAETIDEFVKDVLHTQEGVL